jgi:hypothetical protein
MSREIILDYYNINNKITIYLTNKDENNDTATVKTTLEKSITNIGGEVEIVIDNNIFNELYEELFNIDVKEVLLGNYQDDDIDDGANVDLSFGGDFNQIHFELWGISKNNMKKRNIEKLCKVIERILEIAGINKEEYENDLGTGIKY